MRVFEAENAQQAYLQELRELYSAPIVEVKGVRTREILDVATVLQLPQDMCILLPERHWNPWVALSEGLWLLSGSDKLEDIIK